MVSQKSSAVTLFRHHDARRRNRSAHRPNLTVYRDMAKTAPVHETAQNPRSKTTSSLSYIGLTLQMFRNPTCRFLPVDDEFSGVDPYRTRQEKSAAIHLRKALNPARAHKWAPALHPLRASGSLAVRNGGHRRASAMADETPTRPQPLVGARLPDPGRSQQTPRRMIILEHRRLAVSGAAWASFRYAEPGNARTSVRNIPSPSCMGAELGAPRPPSSLRRRDPPSTQSMD